MGIHGISVDAADAKVVADGVYADIENVVAKAKREAGIVAGVEDIKVDAAGIVAEVGDVNVDAAGAKADGVYAGIDAGVVVEAEVGDVKVDA